MLRFLVRRLAQGAALLLAIATLDFLLLHAAPGDAADAIAGEAGTADAEYVANLRRALGLDRPLHVQLGLYLWRLAQGDFGYSFRYGQSVASLILERIPATVTIALYSMLLTVLAGLAIGVLAALRHKTWVDQTVMTVALIGVSLPNFWLGLVLILVFSVHLGWLPPGGIYDVARPSSGLGHVLDVARHLVLPAFTQSCFFLAIYIRLVRTAMLEAYSADYVRTARAKGLSETRVALRHVLRNALVPLVTMVGLNLGTLLGGAVLVETVFSWPGIGRLMYDAVFQRDVNLLLSILVLGSVVVIVANLLVDLLYAWLTPTVELR